jgi:hypothetical protein
MATAISFLGSRTGGDPRDAGQVFLHSKMDRHSKRELNSNQQINVDRKNDMTRRH